MIVHKHLTCNRVWYTVACFYLSASTCYEKQTGTISPTLLRAPSQGGDRGHVGYNRIWLDMVKLLLFPTWIVVWRETSGEAISSSLLIEGQDPGIGPGYHIMPAATHQLWLDP